MNTILKKSASQLVELIKTKALSSEEVTRAFLERIEQVNPLLNAVIQIDKEKTLAAAKVADLEVRQGKPLGPLHGLPITIKDTIDIFGYNNTYGSHLYDTYTPKTEGTVLQRLRAAGAVILGLTNSPEMLSAYESDNIIFGKTNNPYDTNRSSGGSSGGEAAIIAAHGSPFGLGSDGGGSIRIPAHYCGIAGIKPTQGLVPLSGCALPGSGAGSLQPFGTFGPMARFTDDLILGLSVMSGPDTLDPNTPPVSLGNPNTVDISQLKVAYFMDNGIVTPTQEIMDATHRAAQVLAEMGATIEEVRPPNIERTYELHWEPFFTMCDGGATVRNFLKDIPDERISALRQQFHQDAKACDLTATELNQRFTEIAAFRWSTYQFLNQYDLLVCPPCATPAKPHGMCLTEVKDFTYTMSFNNSGSPAVVIPFASTQSGLPIGIQLVSNLWKDHIALAAAKGLESYATNAMYQNIEETMEV